MVTTIRARLANNERCELGEGPIWDPVRRRAIWLDILRGTVFIGALRSNGSLFILDRFVVEGTIGAAAVDAAGRFLLARNHRLGVRDTHGVLHDGPFAITPEPGRRLNDGKPDPAGRFVVGSLSLDGPSESEELVRLESDGTITVLDHDLTLSNGLAWTSDGTCMYFVDTMRRVVWLRTYDAATGAIGPRSEFLRFAEGYPDGMCLDAEDHLWIAMWGLGQVHRYSPCGELVAIIEVPAPHTSSVAFIGADLDTLLITTATQDLSRLQLADYPYSGCTFTAMPGVRGLPQPLWDGNPAMINEHKDA